MNIEEIKAQMNALKTQLKEAIRKAFADMSKQLFDKHPDLNSFSWTEYTDYFNDGDACTFSANTDRESISINGYRYDDESDEPDNLMMKSIETFVEYKPKPGNRWDYNEIKTPNSLFDPSAKQAVDDVVAFLGAFESDDYEMMFGDHCEVTVNRDGTIIIESYTDHD